MQKWILSIFSILSKLLQMKICYLYNWHWLELVPSQRASVPTNLHLRWAD